MKRNFFVVLLLLYTTILPAQEIRDIKIRDIDAANFQRIKIYTSILDEKNSPILNLDSGKIVIKENETGKVYTPKPSIFFESNEGMMICIAIDASNSMEGPPLDNVKQGLMNILDNFRQVDKMGIAIFHDRFIKKSEFGNDREVLKNNIGDLTTGGSSTELYQSVIQSLEWLKKYNTPKRKVLIIVSDGDDNGTQYSLSDCIREIEKSGISVFTIGSIAEKNENKGTLLNMDKLASASKDGKYFKISSPEDIKNIIPIIYDIIKKEYVLEYYSWANPLQNITGTLTVKFNGKKYEKDFKYTAPKSIVENHPSESFFKSKEFLYIIIIVGIIIIALGIIIWLNVKKKKQYKTEKEKEVQLREKEARENRERYDKLMNEYNSILDKIEQQSVVSQADKEKIELLENRMREASKTMIGDIPQFDVRRRTQILTSKTSDSTDISRPTSGTATIRVLNGFETGKQMIILPEGILIGRQQGQLIISDNSVSRRHARIFQSAGGYSIEDFGSTNGTFVNNNRVKISAIKSGDKIRLGNIELLFQVN